MDRAADAGRLSVHVPVEATRAVGGAAEASGAENSTRRRCGRQTLTFREARDDGFQGADYFTHLSLDETRLPWINEAAWEATPDILAFMDMEAAGEELMRTWAWKPG